MRRLGAAPLPRDIGDAGLQRKKKSNFTLRRNDVRSAVERANVGNLLPSGVQAEHAPGIGEESPR